MKKVIGILGTIGSGKGTIANFLKNFGYKKINMGNLVRAEARKRKIKPTRENLQNLQLKLRKNNPYYFIDKVIAKIEKSKQERWVVDGLRNPEDVKKLKKIFKAKIIFVDAPVKLRWERVKKRRRGEEAKISLKKFIEIEKKENKMFKFNLTKKYADFKIVNDSTKEELYRKVMRIIK
jgi:dephospho-CoA kinase